MKKLAQILTIVLSVVLISCTTDNNNEDDANDPADPTNPTTLILLKKRIVQDIEYNEEVTVNYVYEGNRLINYNTNTGFSETYTYTNDLLTRIDVNNATTQASHTILEYDTTNTLTQFTTYYADGDATKYVVNYISANRIQKLQYLGDHTNQSTLHSETIEEFSNGNRTKIITPADSNESTYVYDTKNGALKNIHVFEIFQLIVDTDEEISENNPVNLSDEYFIQYTYNTNNFPATSSTSLNDSSEVFTTQYFYE